MKHLIIILLAVLLATGTYGQKPNYTYQQRITPTVKLEKLPEARALADIAPRFWPDIPLSYGYRLELEERRKAAFALGYDLYPAAGYERVVDYLEVQITATSGGRQRSAVNISDQLTAAQKEILAGADPGTDISIRVRFRYKDNDSKKYTPLYLEGFYTVTAVPEKEAVFPGGYDMLAAYLEDNFVHSMPAANQQAKIRKLHATFTINEEGRVEDARIIATSGDTDTDKLLIYVLQKMPQWKPAENSRGLKVKQSFHLPFAFDGC